jgi:hypothetical protein
MTQVPAPRGSGSVSTRGGGAVAKKSPGSIDYVPADAVGFEILPEALRRALSGVLLGTELAADAEHPVTKRRQDGTHYQSASGWWVSSERVVVVEGRRTLERVGDNQFKPSGEWAASGTVYQFPLGLVPETSRWRFDGGAAGDGKTRKQKAANALDALPPPLVAPVLGGLAGAWQRYRRGWAMETVVALRLTNDRVKVLSAEREANSLRALASSDWRATTLDSPIVAALSITSDSRGRVELGQSSTASQLHQ